MNIEDIKTEMEDYLDFYGGDLLEASEIDLASTKQELKAIIDHHRDHIESMLSDADNHLDALATRCGLVML
ncbi:MAG: hypothetical protein ACUZ8E_06980 [Candidatus Anammoxibacter sp.]